MWKKLVLMCLVLVGPVHAQEKSFTLQAPEALVETGFLKHLLPRFSLKKGIRVTLTDDGAADARLGADGMAVFRDDATVWHLSKTDGPFTDAFQDWLVSDIGKRTIEAFKRDGAPIFSADVGVAEVAAVVEITGDVELGERVALTQCGRCHVVNEKNRMNAIGSTPSFGLMRNFADWQQRFEAFYALRPHGAFTQVRDVTPPFPDNLPPPIAPIEVTLDDIAAITAYVGSIAPADLGAPIQGGGAFQ